MVRCWCEKAPFSELFKGSFSHIIKGTHKREVWFPKEYHFKFTVHGNICEFWDNCECPGEESSKSAVAVSQIHVVDTLRNREAQLSSAPGFKLQYRNLEAFTHILAGKMKRLAWFIFHRRFNSQLYAVFMGSTVNHCFPVVVSFKMLIQPGVLKGNTK